MHIWLCLFFSFNLGKSSMETRQKIIDDYGIDVVAAFKNLSLFDAENKYSGDNWQ